MKTYTQEELAVIIEKHGKWLNDEEGGERADLRSANLRSADLRSANLRSADLRSADLYGADLRSADLYGADLRSANLSSADLYGADLRSANLSSADLYGADLRSANLSSADLYGADLRSANLSSADLYGADLRSANLREIKSLWGASGNRSEIKAIQCDTWPVTYTATHMQIGCQFHTLKEWWKFSDEEISRMDSQALAWWKVWKPILRKIIKVSPAEPTGYVESKE